MADEHYCQVHHCKFYRNEKNGKEWYSHKIKDGEGYCNEPKTEGNETEVRQQAAPTPPVAQVKPQSNTPPAITGHPVSQTLELSKDAQIERAVWIKEMGECIRTLAINKETPAGLEMMVWYYTEMRRVCGIMTGKEVNVKQKNTLVEQAKKQGAEEVK